MEVHHHPHVEKKNFKEYLLEGLMIFLAVTLGFFAESYRESLVNNSKEKHYEEGLYDDLKKDTTFLNSLISQQEFLINKIENAREIDMDSLRNLPKQELFYKNFIYGYWFVPVFRRNDATITQLKSAAGFNVIRNQSLIDSISRLDHYFEGIKYNNDWYITSCEDAINAANNVIIIGQVPSSIPDTAFDFSSSSKKIFSSTDIQRLVPLYNIMKIQQAMLEILVYQEKKYLQKSINIISLLKDD